VRDNGPGIPVEIRDRLFEPFATYGKTGGTGLGLAIVKNVVTAHRGKITFETQAGQGTEFLIQIPQDASSRAVA
jgi:signal transduction histidine kinase